MILTRQYPKNADQAVVTATLKIMTAGGQTWWKKLSPDLWIGAGIPISC
jgi:hypothetical protein